MKLSRAIGAWTLLALLLGGGAGAQTPVGAAFTYQGRLLESALPANGSYDFRFTLFDALAGGNVVGGPLTLPGVAVAQGLFTVSLDFGSAAFQGQARWLEIEVQLAGGGGYTTLTPRQQLAPSPYTVFSSYTDPANLTSLNASNLTSGTVPGARLTGTYPQVLALSNAANTVSGTFTGDGFALTNLNASSLASGTVPSAVVSGTYSSALTFPNAGNFFTGDGSGLTNLNAQPKYVRTVVVSPVGAPAANGAALLAALAGITTASASNPWLLKIEPGIYDVGATSLVMKPFVDVEGSGEATTKITGVGNASNAVGTVQVVANTELRFVTVENTGGAAIAKAIFVDTASPRITHVTAVSSGATGGENQGIFVQGAGAAPLISEVTIQVIGNPSAGAFGMLDIGSSSVQRNLNVFATGSTYAQAVWIYGGATPSLRNVFIVASGASTENRAVVIVDSSPQLENVVAIATGPATANTGVLSSGASFPNLRLVTCRGLGATTDNVGCGTYMNAAPTMDSVLAEGFGGVNAVGFRNIFAGPGISLSNVRALASGASSTVAALLNESCSPRVTHLDAFANGSGSAGVYGLYLSSTSSSVSHATVTVGGATTGVAAGVGVFNTGILSNPTLADSVISAAGSSNNTYGVWNTANTSITLSRVTASVAGAGGTSYGVINQFGSQVFMTDVHAVASGPSGNIAGVYNLGATVQMAQVVAAGSGPAGNRYGMFNEIASSAVTADRCTFNGATNSILNGGGSGVRVGGSQVVGPVTTIAGSSTSCVLSYSGGYALVNALCQ